MILNVTCYRELSTEEKVVLSVNKIGLSFKVIWTIMKLSFKMETQSFSLMFK